MPAEHVVATAVPSGHLDGSRNILIDRMLYTDFKCQDNMNDVAQHSAVVAFVLHAIRVWVECTSAHHVHNTPVNVEVLTPNLFRAIIGRNVPCTLATFDNLARYPRKYCAAPGL